MNMLRLPGSVAQYFELRLREKLPTKAERILNHIKEERGGRLNTSKFGERMRGGSQQWLVAEQMFKLHCQRLGLNKPRAYAHEQRKSTYRRPSRQATLFE
jgi:DNA repair photolyase